MFYSTLTMGHSTPSKTLSLFEAFQNMIFLSSLNIIKARDKKAKF
jgi:hypothetical protein